MQLNLNIETPTQTQKAWAFAVEMGKVGLRSRSKSLAAASHNLNRCIITACSKEAKELGVRVGMGVHEAKTRIPSLKILVCNW